MDNDSPIMLRGGYAQFNLRGAEIYFDYEISDFKRFRPNKIEIQ